MTTIKEIYCHEFDSKQAAVNFMQNKVDHPLIIPFQGLFINDNPNILPLDYFLKDHLSNNAQQYKLIQIINKALRKFAPKGLPKKSILAISYDILHHINHLNEYVFPYPWLEAASKEINTNQSIINHKEKILEIIDDTSHWIDYHYHSLVLFGLDNKKLPIIKQIIRSVNCKIWWVVASDQIKEYEIASDTIDEWLMNWGKVRKKHAVDLDLHSFESVEDECKQVVLAAKNRQNLSNKVAIIIPSQHYMTQLEMAANRLGVDIFFGKKIKLEQTMIGIAVKQIIEWIQSNDISSLYEILLLPIFNDWEGVNLVRNKIDIFMKHQMYLKKSLFQLQKECLELTIDDRIKALFQIKSLDDIEHWIKQLKIGFSISNAGYLEFQSSELINIAITDSKDMETPLDYIGYVLSSVWLDSSELSDPKIICVEPEDICRFPTYDYFVLGISQESWVNNEIERSYLNIDTLGESSSTEYRYYLLCWILKSSSVLLASFSNKIDHKPAHLIEGINGKVLHITEGVETQLNYQRKLGDLSLSAPNTLSPSSIEQYQKCPYSFFMRHVLRIKVLNDASSQQLFGTIFHQIIEKVALKEINHINDVKMFLCQSLTLLQADVFLNKMMQKDWNLKEILNFFNHKKTITAEKRLTLSINGVTIQGRPDLIHTDSDGIEIIDVKTGQPPSLLDIKRFQYIQLGIYGMMAQKEYHISKVTGSILSKNNNYHPMITQEETKRSVIWQEYKDELSHHLTNVINEIKNKKFDPNNFQGLKSNHLNQCRVCNYYQACHSKERHQR